MSDMIHLVTVIVSCPNCGAEEYEFEFFNDELNSEMSVQCDECPNRIAVYASVSLQTEKPVIADDTCKCGTPESEHSSVDPPHSFVSQGDDR